MEKTISPIQAEICRVILNDMSEHLPWSHMAVLDDTLAGFTLRETLLMKFRLDRIPAEEFPILLTKLANATVDNFHSYLGASVTTSQDEENYGYNPCFEVFDDPLVVEEVNNGVDKKTCDGHVDVIKKKEYPREYQASTTLGDKTRGHMLRPNHSKNFNSATENKGSNEALEQQEDARVRDAIEVDAYSNAEQLNDTQIGLALSLRRRLFGDRGVPIEIYQMLIQELFRALYLPGVVIPSQYVDSDGHAYFADVGLSIEKSRLFHDIDPYFYSRYKDLYWSQNTWEIQCGDLGYTLDFLNLLPPENYLQIRSVALTFSIADSDSASSYYYVYEPELTLLENLENYDRDIHTTSRDLNDIWFWKFETVSGLRLEHLTLNFTDAFSVSGEFLGVHAATQFHAFTYGLPKLTIYAPTEELEAQIRALFVAAND